MNKSSVFLFTAGTIAAFVLAIFIGQSAYEKYQRNKHIESEIAELQKKAEELSQKNGLLSDQIQYFRTQNFKDKEVKEKLNMKKPNEEVVIVTPSPAKNNPPSEESVAGSETQINLAPEQSNPKKWWNHFFKY